MRGSGFLYNSSQMIIYRLNSQKYYWPIFPIHQHKGPLCHWVLPGASVHHSLEREPDIPMFSQCQEGHIVAHHRLLLCWGHRFWKQRDTEVTVKWSSEENQWFCWEYKHPRKSSWLYLNATKGSESMFTTAACTRGPGTHYHRQCSSTVSSRKSSSPPLA